MEDSRSTANELEFILLSFAKYDGLSFILWYWQLPVVMNGTRILYVMVSDVTVGQQFVI